MCSFFFLTGIDGSLTSQFESEEWHRFFQTFINEMLKKKWKLTLLELSTEMDSNYNIISEFLTFPIPTSHKIYFMSFCIGVAYVCL